MTSMTGTRRLVISAVVLAVAAVVVMMMLASRPTSSAMAGMDHGSEVAPESSQSTASPGDMAGMDGMDHETPEADHHAPGTDNDSGDVPGMEKPASTPTPTMAEDMPGMDHSTGDSTGVSPEHGDTVEAASNRPLAPVLGAFGGGTSAVLLTAGFLRRKDRAADRDKQAARAARRSQK
jgi:uncharacterized protein involved in copper resistance